MKKIGIVMGSDSDLPVIEKAVSILREMNIPFEVHLPLHMPVRMQGQMH